MSGRFKLSLCLLALSTMGRNACADILNGDFQASPNVAWKTDRQSATLPGDAPAIGRGLKQNRFGHVGDRDGRGNHGQIHSRIFQSFVCGGDDIAKKHCEVAFRYKTGFTDEMAYVALSGPTGRHVWRLPSTGGLWSGPDRVFYPSRDSVLTVEFGVVGTADQLVAGYLSVDDVRDTSAVLGRQMLAVLEPADEDRVLSGFPAGGGSVMVELDVRSVYRPRPVSSGIAALVVTGLVLLLWRMSRCWRRVS